MLGVKTGSPGNFRTDGLGDSTRRCGQTSVFPADDIEVRFYEDDENGWQAFGDFSPTDVHKQVPWGHSQGCGAHQGQASMTPYILLLSMPLCSGRLPITR